jgi:hypothetical protein
MFPVNTPSEENSDKRHCEDFYTGTVGQGELKLALEGVKS